MIRYNVSYEQKLEACFFSPFRAVVLSVCLAFASAGEFHSSHPYAP
jgi:hypothetical protein